MVVKTIKEALLPFEDWKEISEHYADPKKTTCIFGDDLLEQFKITEYRNPNPQAKMDSDTLYALTMAYSGTVLVKRISMAPKTRANIAKHSNKYGSEAIIKEIMQDNI